MEIEITETKHQAYFLIVNKWKPLKSLKTLKNKRPNEKQKLSCPKKY